MNNKNKILYESCEVADNFLSKFIGLMFNFKKNRNILFIFKEGKNPIHSLFVFQDFYAIYLDKKMKVTEIFKVKPFKFYISNKKPAKYLLESTDLEVIPKIGEELKCLDGKY